MGKNILKSLVERYMVELYFTLLTKHGLAIINQNRRSPEI